RLRGTADGSGMRRHLLLLLFALALVVPTIAAGSEKRSWAQAQIKLVTSRGLMGGDASRFEPDAPLTQGALPDPGTGPPGADAARPTAPAASVTLAGLDATLVKALGLGDAATTFLRAARSAGLAPPSRFGSEAAARLLGLRTNHPAGQDSLELLPGDAAT